LNFERVFIEKQICEYRVGNYRSNIVFIFALNEKDIGG